jgi:endonuclease YncB( thermonuclease family)
VLPPHSGFSVMTMAWGGRHWRGRFAAGVLALAGSYLVTTDSASAAACGSETIGSGQVATVTDGRTFGMADGREVRLAGIEVPVHVTNGPDDASRADAARAALAAMVAGQTVTLKRLDADSDRYGRTAAHVFIQRDGTARSVQGELLAQGHARVAARLADRACALEFLALERAARTARLGLWGDPYYEPRRADMPAEILTERGRFTLVEGKVSSVRESGGTIYVNFGTRWSQGFAITIAKRNAGLFTSAGLEPKTLNGRRIRVRGWIEARTGPRVQAIRPEQIEIVGPN